MEWEEVTPDEQAQGTEVAAAPVQVEPAFEEVLPDTGEEHPAYANGLAPTSPINKSPVELEDRLKMSVGNDAGKEAFLKQKFEAVTKDEDGNFIVQKDGLWHRVDAKNFEGADPWKVTKSIAKLAVAGGLGLHGILSGASQKLIEGDEGAEEFVKDAADVAPEATAIAGSVGLGIATGGASVAAQVGAAGAGAGAMAAIRTSLGRAVGTYEAPVEEQIKDIAFESILNTAGVAIPLGVKPTAAFMAKKLPLVAKAMRTMDEVGHTIMKNTWGRLSVGTEAWDTFRQMPDDVASSMSKFGSAKEGFEQAAQKDSIAWVQRVSKTARETLNTMYDKMSTKIVSAAPADFVAPLREPMKDIYEEAVTSGLGTLKVNGKLLSQTETIEQLAKGVPKGAEFVLKSAAQMKEEMLASGNLGQYAALADDAKAHRMVTKAFKQIESLSNAKPLTGKAGAQQMLDLQKITNSITYDLKTQGKNIGNSVVQKFATNVNGKMKNRYTQLFDDLTEKSGSGKGLYTSLNEKYSTAKSALDTLVSSTEGKANSKAAESFVTKLTSTGSKNVTEKEALRQLGALTQEFGLPQAKVVSEVQKRIRINEAALKFNPLVKPGFLGAGSQTMVAGSLGAGALGAGASGGGAALAAGAGVLMTSPKIAYNMMRTKDFVSSLSGKALEELRQRPELLLGLTQAATQAGALEETVKTKLLGGQGGTL